MDGIKNFCFKKTKCEGFQVICEDISEIYFKKIKKKFPNFLAPIAAASFLFFFIKNKKIERKAEPIFEKNKNLVAPKKNALLPLI